MRSGEVDAVVLAARADRLGLGARANRDIAPGCDAAGVSDRRARHRAAFRRSQVSELLRAAFPPDTKISVTAGAASCWRSRQLPTPVAAFGVREGESLCTGLLGEPDGSRPRSAQVTLPFPANAEAAALIGQKTGPNCFSGRR